MGKKIAPQLTFFAAGTTFEETLLLKIALNLSKINLKFMHLELKKLKISIILCSYTLEMSPPP